MFIIFFKELFKLFKDDWIWLFELLNIKLFEMFGWIKFLVEKGADVKDYGVLCVPAIRGNLKVVKLLVERSADVNDKDREEVTILHYAIHSDNPELIKYLIEKGANVNAKNRFGETVLHYAVCRNNLELAKILVEKGADVNAKDKDGKTVLDYSSGNQKLVDWLKEHGAK